MGEWKKKGHLKNRRIQSTLSVVKMKDVENYCKNPECQYVCSKQRTSITGKRLATCFFYLFFFKCGKSSRPDPVWSFPHFFYWFSNLTESVVNEKCIFTLSIPETEGIITGNSVIRGDGTTCNLHGNGNSGYHRASLTGLTACGHPSNVHKTMRKASFKTTNLSCH